MESIVCVGVDDDTPLDVVFGVSVAIFIVDVVVSVDSDPTVRFEMVPLVLLPSLSARGQHLPDGCFLGVILEGEYR